MWRQLKRLAADTHWLICKQQRREAYSTVPPAAETRQAGSLDAYLGRCLSSSTCCSAFILSGGGLDGTCSFIPIISLLLYTATSSLPLSPLTYSAFLDLVVVPLLIVPCPYLPFFITFLLLMPLYLPCDSAITGCHQPCSGGPHTLVIYPL